MQFTGNTILVTGGGSGIGRGLAESLHKPGNKVIIAGRRQGALDETTRANPGIVSMNLNANDSDAIPAFADRVTAEHPGLNVLVNNAGIMKTENLKTLPAGLAAACHAYLQRNQSGAALLHAFSAGATGRYRGRGHRNHPPAVATDLTPGRSTSDPRMMSLPDFIDQTMQILQKQPTPSEICVERVKFLRFAEVTGTFDNALQQLSGVRL